MPVVHEGEPFRPVCRSGIPWDAHGLTRRAAREKGWVELWFVFIIREHLVCEHKVMSLETPELLEE